MDGKIDVLDYAILKCLDVEGTLWKKKVYDWLTEHQEEFPRMSSVSLQTVGRHVEGLREDGLIESRIVTAEELRRDLIIGFRLTAEGRKTLETQREALLREEVMQAGHLLLSGEDDVDFPVEREPLVSLMCDQFDISDRARKQILPHCETRELVALLAIHYFARSVGEIIRTDEAGKLAELVLRAPALRVSLMQETVVDRIRKYVRDGMDTHGAAKRMWGAV